MKVIYLCVPYTHDNPGIREIRAIQADMAAAKLIEQGHIVFSPISHSHRIAHHLSNHNDGSFWIEQDMPFLKMADELMVVKLDGWDRSKGIEMEIKIAEGLGKPVRFMEPSEIT